MRGDGSCNAGTCETANMSSIQGLPAPGSEASILITRVHIHPLCELVEFWAKFNQESEAEYESLAKSIQSPGKIFQEFDGNPGDQCLAQKDGIWYRARIVSRNGSEYIVFLIDKGISHSTITSMLAWGRGEYFYLLPEVEFCVLANILPVSPLDRWSPLALKFLKSLSGRTVKVFVQDILMQHRLFVLHIPCIEKQMYEIGFARRLSAQMFKDFLLASLQSKSDPTQFKEPQAVITMTPSERLKMKESFMYPELQAGTVETVVVTEVTNPQRIFCQLKVFSQELKKLSEQLSQCCDGRTASRIEPEMIGFPCAARGSDGKWYRSVLQQVFPSNKLVEVLNVDYGTKQIVQMDNVRSLGSEFYRMPVVTYNCSLHGIIDKGVGWTTAQIDYLRTLLLYKTIIAKFEYQSITEGVYYVTLYGDENSNINNLFGSIESCLLQCEKTLGDYAIRASGNGRKKTTALKTTGGTQASKKQLHSEPVEELPMKSTHVAFVQFVSSPSDFWIQTQNYANELEALMEKIAHFYQTVSNDVVKIPSVGLYCAAKAEDGEYYRAIITEVGKSKVKVHFVDYGNSEAVENDLIRSIPEELKKLPFLAFKCTLADVRPKVGEWSPEACELFTKTVMDKSLNVHVVTKIDDCHFVKLTDPEAQGEQDVAKLMYASGFAEKDEIRRDAKVKTSKHIAPIPMAHCIGNVQPHNTVSVGNERVTFKEQMFSIGSVLDVNVSYIESPNDFWCQLVQSYGHLKLLMYDLQAQYRNSEFQPFAEMACVARHPENGLWYRALIVYKHETPHVDVLFIDYGQTETVNVFDLRKIEKGFLTLPGQAFRCSLFNLVDPTSAINDWTEEAVERFHNFVETAANSFVILKCTVYAVMYSNKIVFNIVNLETPFESICTSLVNLVKNDPPIIHSGTTFRLDTYYYSNHNVKTGTEEQVTITSVKNVRHFYCQLKRNADVLEDMQLKVATLCEQLQRGKIPSVFGTLCFAKYTDGQWYRGLIKATKPTIIVHFVDYGDTIKVDQADLLPIPKEASDIMSVPVQAVLCCLSDIPDDITREADSWFVTSSTECEFRALIVAKEADGKLVVELYQGRIQVNSKIKKLFEIEMHTNDPPVCQARKFIEPTVKPTHKMEGMEESKNGMDHSFDRKPQTKHADSVGKKERPTPKPRQNGKGNQQLYKHPHQKDEARNCEEPADAKQNGTPTCSDTNHSKSYGALSRPKYTEHSKQKDKTPLIQTKLNEHESKQRPTCQSPTEESLIDSNILKLETLADLPPKTITSGMIADVYVSHCNSPLSFYVQLIQEEDDIFSLVEKLNDPNKSSNSDIAEVHPGDLVQAEFSEDSSWYRAVVKETKAKTVLVEFVDFGNTATVPLSKISRLDKSFLAFPVYSTHCLLRSAAGLEIGNVLSPEFVSTFENAIGNVGGKKFQCKFIKQSETVWEVSLQDNGVEIDCNPTRVDEQTDTENGHLQFMQQQLQEDQQLEVYIATITDAQTFWCQSADSGELDQISESVAKEGDAASPGNPDALSVGSACIALFSEDQLWYRAEILNITGDELSLLFVDYGNTSHVKLSQVRQIPPQLIQNQVQAFLCVLEGFDSSKGSWEPSAVDELSVLTADQLLQLTVTKVIMEDGKIKCYVRIEREGQVINESMRKFWKNTESEDLKETQTLDENEPSTEAETVTPEGPMEEESSKLPVVEDNVSEIVLLTEGPLKSGTLDYKETCEFLADEDDDPILTDDAKNCSASFVMDFEDQMCSTSSGSEILENLEVNISAITTELCDATSCNLTPDDNDTVFYCTDDESEDMSSSYEARLMDQDLEDQDLSILDATGSEDMSSPLDECFLEAMLGFTETPSKSPSKGDNPDACKYYDQIQFPETPEELVLEACSPVVKRAARLVHLTGKIKEQDTLDDPPPESLQNEDSFLARSSYVLTPDSFDDDSETSEMIVPETPCSAKVTTVQMVPRSLFNPTSKIDIELESSEESQQSQKRIASIVVPSPDSFNSDQVTETPEFLVPEMTVMPDIMEDVCLSSSGFLAEDSFDLGQDVIASETAFPESPASVTSVESNEDVGDVFPPEETSASLTSDQMSEDECFLFLSVALPDDSFDLDVDTWTPDVALGWMDEMDPHTASETMNQDLLLPESGSLPQDSTDDMLDLKAEDILSESSKKEEMPKDELVSEQTADCPDLLKAGGATAIESDICTAISMGDAGEEGVCVTEVSLLDLCAVEKGERENVFDESGDHLRSEEETLDKCAPSVEVPCGQLIVLDDVETEAEPESCSYSPMSHFPDYPDMAVLTEHVSGLVEEATSTDLTPGEAAAESESSDSLDECLLTMEDSSDDTLTEDSYAEDCLEALLSKVTPLSLLEDGCAQEKLAKE